MDGATPGSNRGIKNRGAPAKVYSAKRFTNVQNPTFPRANGQASGCEPSLDISRLEKVKHLDGGAIQAACPACRAEGSDKGGDHLRIQQDGKFGCAARPGDAIHRKQIFQIVGIKAATNNGGGKKIVATYPYHDAEGNLLFEVVRFEPKDFRQRRPEATALDGWTWNTKGVNRVLFRLPEILTAIEEGLPVYLTEGEKDALAIVKAGFAATCNAGGAGKSQWANPGCRSRRKVAVYCF